MILVGNFAPSFGLLTSCEGPVTLNKKAKV